MRAPSPSVSISEGAAMGRDASNARLVDVELDESIGRSTPDVEHERAVAIFEHH